MSPIAVIVLIFSLLGAVDYLLKNRFGIGKEFEKAFSLFGPMASGVCAVLLALLVYRKQGKEQKA